MDLWERKNEREREGGKEGRNEGRMGKGGREIIKKSV